MEDIYSSNVYLEKLGKEEAEEDARSSEDDDNDSSTKRKRNSPYWSRSNDDEEEAEYTDWTLEVKVKVNEHDALRVTNNNVISYSVHKCLLGIKSEYFKGIFRGGPDGDGFSESHKKLSTIELPTSVVTIHHFENLLDYLYTGNLVLHTNNVIAMVYFGDYFVIECLKHQVQRFIRKSVTSRTSFVYSPSCYSPSSLAKQLTTIYQDAESLGMKELQKAIVYKCASEPRLMSKDTALFENQDTQFFCLVWDARNYHPQTESSEKLWSVNVANFVELHSDIVDRQTFCKLTGKDSLRSISAEAAVILMEQEQRICTDNELVEKRNHVTCLQQRCIDSLVDKKTGYWKVINPLTLLQGKTQGMPRLVLESLLIRKMNDIKQPSVRVTGAGSKCVNGIYTISGLHNGYPMFTRSVTYEGENKLSCVYKSSLGRSEFYTTLVQEGCILGDGNFENDLYISKHREEELPQEGGWEYSTEGEDPSPKVRFVYNV